MKPLIRSLEPLPFDRDVRALVRRLPSNTAKMMSPLYPLGMPGGYIPIAYATAHWLHRRGKRGGPAIVTAAWTGWLAQRIAKQLFVRERPRRPGVKRRIESFPSGHTTGTTAWTLAAAYVLHREGVVSGATAALLAVGAPVVMGAYRVIDDEHWASDVLAGWVLGAAVGLTCSATLGTARGAVGRRVRGSASSTPASRPRARQARAKS